MRGGRVTAKGAAWILEWVDAAGQRRELATDAPSYAAACALLAKLEAPAPHAAETKGQPVDLESCLASWLDAAILSTATATQGCYRQKAGHVARLLGTRSIAALRLEEVEGYIAARLAEGAARETCRKELVVLRQALRWAQRRGWLPDRDLDLLFPAFCAPYRPRDRWLTQDQAAALLEALPAQRRLWVLLAAWGGLRLSEVEGLQWGDLDFAQGLIRVRGTKTDGSYRVVGLAPGLAAALLACRAVRGPVVQPWPNVRRDLAAACGRAGVPTVTPNDLRRTFASWLVQAGESNFVVSRLLGHSTTKMVDLVYGHLGGAAIRGAVAKLPELPQAAPAAPASPRPGRLRKRPQQP